MRKIPARTLQAVTIGLVIVGVIALALSGMLNQIVGKTISPFVSIQGWFATRVQSIVEFITIPNDIESLRTENAELKNEISQLQSELLDAKQQLTETEILYALLDYARSEPTNRYVAASVIGKDPNPFLNYIIIDHGSDDGILKGMPVITQQGLVGKITAVTASAARVQLITDPGSSVNVRISNGNTEAQIVGSVTGDITLEMVDTDANLVQGDLILTSGLGGSFPSDLLIGQVISPHLDEDSLFQIATIQPVVDFTNLRAVLIITNFEPVDYSPLLNQ